MDETPRYSLTEEVVRQTTEVVFRGDDRWQVAFSNPTAGPWKKITLGKYIGTDLRYLKEEDRPDLILFNSSARLFLVLEAKDDIRKLIASQRNLAGSGYEQLQKSVEVFAKEARRIDAILADTTNARLVFGLHGSGPYNIVCGYVYSGVSTGIATHQAELQRLHRAFVSTKADARLLPFIAFIVRQAQSTLNLITEAIVIGADAGLARVLRSSLPTLISANLVEI